MMYISICLNKRIPLRTIMLLCPLDMMINYYEIYHEMNDEQLINNFIKNNYQVNILRTLRKKRKLTVRQLANISNISELTIKYYEKDNNHIFNASFENISRLIDSLNYSSSYFSRYSKFVPYTYLLFEDEDVFKKLCERIDVFYNSQGSYTFDGALLTRSTKNKKEYVPKIYIDSSIRQMLIENSKTETLLY